MARTLLFVYGTLKRGQRNHARLAGQEFVGEAQTLPRYRLYDRGRYPCLVEVGQAGVAVRGEVWRVDEADLACLDEFEGAPTLFRRRVLALPGFAEPVETYYYQRPVHRLPDCGTCWPRSSPEHDTSPRASPGR